MEFSRDVRVVDNETNLAASIYIYLMLFKSKQHHLSEMELKVYARLLLSKQSGLLKKGYIRKEIQVSNKSIYTYIDRIKEAGLLRKNNDDFVFPEDMLKIASSVLSGESVSYTIKFNGSKE